MGLAAMKVSKWISALTGGPATGPQVGRVDSSGSFSFPSPNSEVHVCGPNPQLRLARVGVP